MASYWRALALAAVLSLGAGLYGYRQGMPPPGVYYTLPPIVPAAIAAGLVFCAVTTLQAIRYLIRRRIGVSGVFFIVAGLPCILYVVLGMAAALINDGRPGRLRELAGDLAVYLPGALLLPIWLVPGAWLLYLSRRNRRSAASDEAENGAVQAQGWPPLPGQQ